MKFYVFMKYIYIYIYIIFVNIIIGIFTTTISTMINSCEILSIYKYVQEIKPKVLLFRHVVHELERCINSLSRRVLHIKIISSSMLNHASLYLTATQFTSLCL